MTAWNNVSRGAGPSWREINPELDQKPTIVKEIIADMCKPKTLAQMLAECDEQHAEEDAAADTA